MNDRHQAPSYPLRMPPELKERMMESAKLSGRSLHAEIVARLTESFEPSCGTPNLQEVAEAHKSTAAVLGVLSTTLANMLLSSVRLFTPEQRKKLMQIGVWEAIAEGVVQGKGVVIVEALHLLNTQAAAAPSLNAVDRADKSVLELLHDLEVDSKKSYVMRKAREEQMASEKSASSKKR